MNLTGPDLPVRERSTTMDHDRKEVLYYCNYFSTTDSLEVDLFTPPPSTSENIRSVRIPPPLDSGGSSDLCPQPLPDPSVHVPTLVLPP